MAERQFTGIQKIGSLLFGGAERMRNEAFEEGRLNTIKTEQALANARKSQLEATAKANAQRAADKWKDSYIANETGKGRDPKEVALDADFIGNTVIGGLGSDFYATMQGQSQGQEIRFRDLIADPETPRAKAHAVGSAIQGKLLPRIAPVGTYGTENLLDETPELTGVPGGGTTAGKNYEQFVELGGPPGPSTFMDMVRTQDRVVTSGGVPAVARVGPTGGGPATPVVSAEDAASNKAALADASRTGTETAKMRSEYPRAKFARDRTVQDITAMNDQAMEIAKNEKLYQAFGLTRPIAMIPGTEGANLRAMVQTLTSKMMITTLLNLRAMSKTGGAVGNVSDREGLKMETALANLSDPNISVGQVFKEVKRLIGYNADLEALINESFDLTYDAKGEPRLATQGARSPTDGGEDTLYSNGDPVEGATIEEEIINRGDGDYNETGNLVDSRGWVFMKSPDGAAWVNPDGSGEYEEVAQ